METTLKETGFILLADISGWHKYMSEAELEHAAEATADLLTTIANQLTPPMHNAGILGDAVLAYIGDGEIGRADRIVDLSHHSYGVFKDTLLSMRRHTTCDCRACLDLPNLDLNLLIHHGEYLVADMHGRQQINGLAASLVRDRVFKDQLDGKQAVGLLTGDAVQQIGMASHDLTTTSSAYDLYGNVETVHLDLQATYEAARAEQNVTISPEDADIVMGIDLDAPPQVVWEWLNVPEYRSLWMNGRQWEAGLRPGGRLTTGAVNHCYHGIGKLMETILTWRPYETFTGYVTSNTMKMYHSYQLTSLDDGRTHLEYQVQFDGLLSAPLVVQGTRAMIKSVWGNDLKRLAKFIRERA